jgi:hypothetical protein
MLFGLGNFPKDLHTLVGQFEPCFPTRILEIRHATFDF